MATATYRIGPSDFFSPGDLEADAQTLDNQVEQLDAQIEGNTAAPETFVDQWVSWQGQWKAFLANNFSGYFSSLLSSLNDANRDALISYENQFSKFASSAGSFGVQVISPVAPSTGSQDTLGAHLNQQTKDAPSLLPSVTTLVVLAVAVVVVLVVWKS